MATYLDGTEKLPSTAPRACPLCKKPVATKWAPQTKHGRKGYYVVAVPAHVCEHCGVAVRVLKLPRKPLHDTRDAARAAGRRDEKAPSKIG